MPTSQHHQISKIVGLIIDINPQSILDIGVGFGKYGFLSREYLEFWDGRNKLTFKRRIDGIEVYTKYLTPVHKYIYNQIYEGDAAQVIDNIKRKYDLVLLIDVLEHFTKENGAKLVKKILKTGKGVLISTPKDIGDRGHAFDNLYEEHVTQWKKSELAEFGTIHSVYDQENYILYIGKPRKAAEIKRRAFIRKAKHFVRGVPWLYWFIRKVRR